MNTRNGITLIIVLSLLMMGYPGAFDFNKETIVKATPVHLDEPMGTVWADNFEEEHTTRCYMNWSGIESYDNVTINYGKTILTSEPGEFVKYKSNLV